MSMEQPRKNFVSFEYENEWNQGLFECCSDCKICCCAFWFLPCFECILFTDAREYLGTYFYPNSLANLRTKIRSTYRINGVTDCDALAVLFCRCCALIQMKKELIAQGEIKDSK